MTTIIDHTQNKTREQLVREVNALRTRVAELEAIESECKQAEKRLGLFSAAVEQSAEGIAVVDLDGNLLFANRAFAAMHGYTPQELSGKHLSIFHIAEQLPDVEAANQQIQKTGEFRGEIWHARRDGSVFPTLMHNSLMHDEAGQPIGMIGTLRDITKHKETEDALRRRAEELDGLQATVLDITVPHDLPSLLETIVERAARLLAAPSGGLYLYEPEQEQLRLVVSHNLPAEYVGTVLNYGEGAAGTVAQTGQPLRVDDYRTWNGRASIYEEDQALRAVLAVPMIWQGRVIGVIDVMHYSTDQIFSQADLDLLIQFASHATIAVENTRLFEQAQAEIALRKELEQQSEERRVYVESLLAYAPDAIISLNADHQILEWNPGAEALFGYTQEEAVGRDLDELITIPEGRIYDEALGFTQQALGGDPVPPTEIVRYRQDRTPVNVILAGAPILVNSEVVGTVAVYTDITKRKKAEEALRKAEREKETILDSLVEHVVHQDLEMRVLWANRAACDSLNLEREQVIGQFCHELWPKCRETCPDCPVMLSIETGQPQEMQRTTSDGRGWYVRGYPVRDEQGNVVGGVEITLNITEKMQTENALRKSEASYRTLFEQATDAIILASDADEIIDVNRRTCELLGYSREELLSMKVPDLQAPEIRGQEGTVIKSEWKDHQGAPFESLDIHRDGTRIPVEISIARLASQEGSLTLSIVRDITERKRAEQALRESEQKFRNIVESNPMGMHIYQLEPDGRLVFTDANQAADEILDVGNEQFIGKTIEEAFPALTDSEVPSKYRMVARTGQTWRRDEILYEENQISGAFEVYAFQTSPGKMAAAFLDVTERKRAEEALRESEELFRLVFEHAPIGMAITTLDGQYLRANQAFCDTLGYTAGELKNLAFSDITFAEDVSANRAMREKVLRDEIPSFQMEQRFVTRTEGIVHALLQATLVRDAQGRPLHFLSQVVDITERKQAMDEIRQLKEFNEGIVQNMTEGIVMQDADGILSFVNPATAAMLDYKIEDMLGRHWELIFPPDWHTLIEDVDRRRADGESHRYQVELLRKDGIRLPVLVSGSPRFREGRFDGTMAVFTDISERVEAEKKLARHAREMAGLYETSLEINAQPDLSTLLNAIVQRATELVDAKMGALYLTRENGDELELIVGYNMPGNFIGTSLRLGEGVSGRVAQTGKPLMVPDYQDWIGRSEIYASYPFRRVLGVPLKVGERSIGVINVADDEQTGFFNEAAIRLVGLFADQAAIAVENAHLFEAEARLRREAETLSAATQALSSTLDLQQVFELILNELGKVVPYDSATVQQRKGDRIEIIGGQGFPNLDGLVGVGFDLGTTDNPNQIVAQTQIPLILEDASAHYEEFRREPHAPAGVRSWLGVPLLFGDRLIGMIALDKKEPGYYTQEHANLALAFAAQAAIAIENARLFEAERTAREQAETNAAELRARERHLTLLNDIRRIALEEVNFEAMLQSLVDRLGALFGADGCYITLWDATRQRTIPTVATAPRAEPYSSFQVEPGEATITESVLRAGHALVIDNVHDTPYVSSRIAALSPSHSVLGLPLIANGQTLGATIIAFHEPHRFTADQVSRGEEAAGQIALAIAKARLLETEREQRELAEALRRAAAAVSSTLDLEQTLDHILEQVDRVIPNDAVNVSLIEEEEARIVRSRGYEHFEQDVHSLVLRPAETANLRHIQDTGQALFISDTRSYLGWIQVPESAWVRSYAGAPIRVRDRIIGFLNADSATPGFFDQTHADRLQAFADQAGLALENARLFREINRRVEYLDTLNRIGLAIATDLDLDKVLNTLYDQIRRVVDVGAFYVALYDEESKLIDFPLLTGVTGSHKIEKLHIEQRPGITGYVIRSKQPIYVPDTRAVPGQAPYGFIPLIEMPTRSYIGVPLIIREKVIGVLSIQSYEPNAYTQTDVELLTTIASQASVAIDNASLFQIVEQGKRDWEATFDAMQDSVVLVDHQYRIIRANKALADLVEKTPADLIDQEYLQLVAGTKDGKQFPPPKHETEDHQPTTWLHEYQDRIFEVQSTPLPQSRISASDPAPGLILVMRDITERRQAEREIRRRNRELTLLNRVIAASAVSLDTVSILETVCQELAQAFDVPQSAAALFDRQKTEAIVVAEYLAEGRPPSLGEVIPIAGNPSTEYLIQHKAPLVVADTLADVSVASIRDLVRRRGTMSLLLLPLIIEGEVLGSLGVDAVEPRSFSDDEVALAQRVAEQVSGALARARLEETQRRLSAAVEQAAEAIFITETDGTIIYVNPAFERLSGYSPAESLGQNPRLLKSGKHDRAFYRKLWQTITAGQAWQGRFINRRKDGNLFTEEATITPVRNQPGQIVNFVTTMRDVTREVELEAQFYHAQKMEALGQMAGGIAHDFNNLLTVIHLSTRLLERQLHPEDPLWKHVQRIRETGERATTLTKQLLSFSRRDVVELEILDLNQVVDVLSQMLQRIIGETIQLEIDLASDLWPVKIDPSQLDQVIMNLVVNARDAMPDGGTLTIETANVVVDAAYAAVHVDAQPGEHAMLTVRDTGIGMDEEVRAHLFEPFFTTKERGQGTGLGLPTVFGIVRQNRGHIRVASEVGIGTTIEIYLPSAGMDEVPAELASRALPVTTSKLVRGTETVLVVEDEQDVRDLAVQVLRSCGYHVLAADSGPTALTISQAYTEPIHLLLTDVVMPHMSGRELAEQLQDQRSEMKILYMSGYADDAIMERGMLPEGTSLLSKPLTIEGLTQQVRAMLDGRM